MADIININVKAAELVRYAEQVERWAIQALRLAINPVFSQVRDFTPRWRGGLVASVRKQEQEGGRVQVVLMPGTVVGKVHEFNGVWKRWPPTEPIRAWVTGKLGLSGKEAGRVTFLVRRKIKNRGLTLPNVEGRGKMFKRTFDLMRQTRAHFAAFRAAIRQLLTAR